MAYPFPYYGQSMQYQDQLSQLRSNQMIPQPSFLPRQENSGILWVQGEAGAKSWIVAPGTSVLLMDSETQRFYVKTADQSGMPNMKTFEYSEIGAAKPQEPQQEAKFVTLEEFNAFRNEIMGKLEEPVEVSLSRRRKGETNE